MPELQRLRAGHAPAVLAFEVANRAYFAAAVSDRGDEFFERFPAVHRDLLAEQEAGRCASYVLVAGDGSVLGRFNLYDIAGGSAVLGYRMARRAAGRGAATAAVRQLCALAVTEHGLRTLRAATAHGNTASQRVLAKAGFVPAGPADPAEIGGKQGLRYVRDLAGGDPYRPAGTGGWELVGREPRGLVGRRPVIAKTFRMPDGTERVFTLTGDNDRRAAACVALTSRGTAVLAEQYRPGPERLMAELPGGGVEPGEPLADGAARELAEETGYVARELTYLGPMHYDAYTGGQRHYFLAAGCERLRDQQLDPGEFVTVREVTLGNLVTLALTAALTDPGGVLLALPYLIDDPGVRAALARRPLPEAWPAALDLKRLKYVTLGA